MKKLISLLYVLSISALLAACATPPDTGNSADQQRARADKAKGELSTEINKQ